MAWRPGRSPSMEREIPSPAAAAAGQGAVAARAAEEAATPAAAVAAATRAAAAVAAIRAAVATPAAAAEATPVAAAGQAAADQAVARKELPRPLPPRPALRGFISPRARSRWQRASLPPARLRSRWLRPRRTPPWFRSPPSRALLPRFPTPIPILRITAAFILWGDGTASAGIVSATGLDQFNILGTHPSALSVTAPLFVSVTNVAKGDNILSAQPATLPFSDAFNGGSVQRFLGHGRGQLRRRQQSGHRENRPQPRPTWRSSRGCRLRTLWNRSE